MKKILTLLCALFALSATAQTTIKMKTTKEIGETFTFVVNSDLDCIVDWGDGKNDTIVSTAEPISGKLTGKTVTLKALGLTYLDAASQQLSSISFTSANSLEVLIVSDNNLNSLAITNLSKLKVLWCDNNLLTQIDIKNMPNLQSVIASHNNISKFTRLTTGFPELRDFWVNNNRISAFDLSGSKKIQTINIENNNLKSLTLSPLEGKAAAIFIGGNQLDFTSLWNRANATNWYGTEQTFSFAQAGYYVGDQISVGRNLFGTNQDGTELTPNSYTISWYPIVNGERGEKLVRGTDYTTPNTTDQKHVFSFLKEYPDVQLEIKNTKYFNFTMLSNRISITDPATGIKDVNGNENYKENNSDGLKITIDGTAVVIEADETTPVSIYDAAANLRWQGDILNATRIPLGKGIFIINNTKIAL